MDRNSSGADVSISERAERAGISRQPKPYVLTNNAHFNTIVDLLCLSAHDNNRLSLFCKASVYFLRLICLLRDELSGSSGGPEGGGE